MPAEIVKRYATPTEGPALRPGLFFVPRQCLPLLAALLLAACAGREAEVPGPSPDARDVDAREATAALRAAEQLHEDGRHAEAALRADSLFRAWLGQASLRSLANRALWLEGRAREASGDLAEARSALETLLERAEAGPIRREAVARLAGILGATGEPRRLVELILGEGEGVDEEGLSLVREAALQLPLGDLEGLAARHPLGEARAAAALHAELARALALEGRLDSARRVASRVARVAEPGTEEAEAAAVLARLERGGIERARIGVVLPLTGRFSAIGQLLREGVELGLEEYRRSAGAGIEVELIVEDDRSSPERAVELVERLADAGALAVLGPVRSEPFAAAARARTNSRLLMLSPTATEPLSAPAAYTLWARERRERAVARDVGAWIVGELGLRRTAVLYPLTPGGSAAAEGFREGVAANGGEVVAAQGYHPDSTTFAGPIAEVAVAQPDAVFVAARSIRDVLQIAPQLPYFGLDRQVIAGGETWAEPAVVRRLDRFAADHRLVGVHTDRTDDGGSWTRFRDMYERRYRKALHDNILPALGYDAFKLTMAAVERAGLPLPGAVSRAAGGLGDIEGVTGILRPVPESSTVDRRTRIRMLVDGRLVPANRGELLAWLDRARFRTDSIAAARADSIARARRGEEPPR